ncbi:bacteriohemerythrin [Malonomonas rubra]|nr:bacteriohemerythrin [Malonomonas rubra]
MQIIWDQSYSVGVAQLDEHHKKLIAMINELSFAMKNDRGQQVVKDIVLEMVDYARMHFNVEEELMRKSGYLGLLQHLKEHEVFSRKADELAQRCQEGDFVLSAEVVNFLSDWLKAHILENDKKYSLTMNKKGIC